MPRTNLAVRVAGAEFGIAGEMRRLPAYFDNPAVRISDPRSLGSWYIKGTDESTLVTGSTEPLIN